MTALLLINIHQNDIRPDLYDLTPGNEQLELPADTAKPFPRSRHDQRADTTVTLIKLQIPDIPQTSAIGDIDDLLLL